MKEMIKTAKMGNGRAVHTPAFFWDEGQLRDGMRVNIS